MSRDARYKIARYMIVFLCFIFLIALASAVYAEPRVWTTDINGVEVVDFLPSDIVYIHGEGFDASTPLGVQIVRPDGAIEFCNQGSCNSNYLDGPISSDGNGRFAFYRYQLNGIEGFYNLTVSDGINVGQAYFGDDACDYCQPGAYCDGDADGYAGWQSLCLLCFLCGTGIGDCNDNDPMVNPGVFEEECLCFDGIDNDCDFGADGDDVACACMNGVDDNNNGLIDCADPECSIEVYCTEEVNDNVVCSTFACVDGFDNDGDGFVDLDDPECEAADGYITPGNPGLATTHARISSGQTQGKVEPEIKFAWVLPDDYPESGTNIDIVPSDVSDRPYACIVVMDPQGLGTIMDVWVDVYHPVTNNAGETFKYQAHATLLDPVIDMQEIQDCKNDAVEAWLISYDDAHLHPGTSTQGIDYWIFDQHYWAMYKVYLPMYYHQPAGWYDVNAYAVDSDSIISDMYYSMFEWVPSTYLEKDFDELNFGIITPYQHTPLMGDYDMGTSAAPTLKNEGNMLISVSLEASDMIGIVHGKVIDEFDSQFFGEYLTFPSEQVETFANLLPLCHTEKIDFSVYSRIFQADDYEGTMTIYADGVMPINGDTPDGDFPMGR